MPYAIKTHQPHPISVGTQHRIRSDEMFYGNARWRALRLAYLKRYPLCADPAGYHAADGVVVPATEVHHLEDRRKRPDLTYCADNLQGLCASCHNRITRRRMLPSDLGQAQ
jgi:5-methylcytosine-specific restriction endonuclease McrA